MSGRSSIKAVTPKWYRVYRNAPDDIGLPAPKRRANIPGATESPKWKCPSVGASYNELRVGVPALRRIMSEPNIPDSRKYATLDPKKVDHVAFIQGVLSPRWSLDYLNMIYTEQGIDCVNIGPRFMNAGPFKVSISRMERELRRQFEACNVGISPDKVNKITLVGHSLGGIYASYLAAKFPEMVDKVVLYASPFMGKSNEISDITRLGLLADGMSKVDQFMNKDILYNWDIEKILEKLKASGTEVITINAGRDGIVDPRAGFVDFTDVRAPKGVNYYVPDGTHLSVIADDYPGILGANIVKAKPGEFFLATDPEFAIPILGTQLPPNLSLAV